MGSQISTINNSWSIERSINEEKRKRISKNEVKILLLGSEFSGKSTFTKQVKLMYQGGFLKEDAVQIKPYIRLNLSIIIKDLIKFVQASEKPLHVTENGKIAWKKISLYPVSIEFKTSKDLARYVIDLSVDPAFKSVYYPLLESKRDDAIYLIENCKRIVNDDYVPTKEDMLKCKITSTSGTFDTKLDIGKNIYTFVDVGGQKCERKKWIHQFEDVGLILYFVSLNEFDQPPEEKKETCSNKLQENIFLFEEIINNQFFCHTPVILLFNKKDQFKEKLKSVSLSNYFPDYEMPKNHNQDINADSFISQQFRSRDHFPQNKRLFIHSFNANDTDHILDFFQYVKRILDDCK
ncbi:hypothetical protein CYY_003929 [Polysphondylium violaceum]|uniref:Uncharacterized protein n=1 Tax=Polysphondylium violaceum TaxID=133409 RepID=A0A8J4PVG5_9MYCE|nr:hypothetical protein CYY_003929 [Polysphondylium violaceum]